MKLEELLIWTSEVNPDAINFRVASGLISGLHERNHRNAEMGFLK